MNLGFFKKEGDIKKELVNTPFSIVLKRSELEWVKKQAEEECTSANGLIRKSISFYRKKQQTYVESQ